MRRLLLSLCVLAALVAPAMAAEPLPSNPVITKLQDISVTIKSGRSQGSGTMFNRKVGDDTITYIWTAGHVVDNLRKTRMAVVNGTPKLVVEFEDAQIVQEFKQDGRRIGEIKMEARVIRYSDAQQGEDLALLQVRKKNFTTLENGTTFYLEENAPAIGTDLYHVGSLLGQVGANLLTTGVVSQIGRVLDLGANGVVFDQTTVTAFPGSSGGGVYLRADGRYIGMLVRGAGEQFNLIVPVRRLREWAKTAQIEWAVDPNVPMPSAEELKRLPVEETGTNFQPGADAAKPHSEESINLEYPFLLKLQQPTLAPRHPLLQSILSR